MRKPNGPTAGKIYSELYLLSLSIRRLSDPVTQSELGWGFPMPFAKWEVVCGWQLHRGPCSHLSPPLLSQATTTNS